MLVTRKPGALVYARVLSTIFETKILLGKFVTFLVLKLFYYTVTMKKCERDPTKLKLLLLQLEKWQTKVKIAKALKSAQLAFLISSCRKFLEEKIRSFKQEISGFVKIIF